VSPMRPRVLALAALLGGCTAGPTIVPDSGRPANNAPPPGTAAPGRDAPDKAPGSATAVSGATTALLAESRAERDAGDLGGAAATIERALTIAPDEPLLWVELAEIRFDQGDVDLAAEMARKALTLTGDNSPLAERARRIMGR
jgi:tetratricopeptide (TPR) repeat protein